jgi:TolA-binding protein
MTCLSREDLAMAACHDDDPPHLADCVACRTAVAEQRAVRNLVRRAPAPPLPRARREAIAAELIARVDLISASRSAGSAARGEAIAGRLGSWATAAARRRTRRRLAGAIAVAAAAAALALVSLPAAPHQPAKLASSTKVASGAEPGVAAAAETGSASGSMPAPGSATGAAESAGTVEPIGAPEPSRTQEPAIAQVQGSADFTREVVDDRDVIALRGGSVTLDALETRDVEVTARNTTVRVERAKVRVIARRGAIASVTVFAGAAEITAGGKRMVVEAGMVWLAPAVGPAAALDEFRAGWEALRAGKHRAAITAFDRARDPVVAEDATYWAAIATERAGDRDAAVQRLQAFLAKFPESPHLEAAHRALGRLAPR